MTSVQNNRKAIITLQSDDGEIAELHPGINHNVPEWIGDLRYAAALHEAGDILVIEGLSLPEHVADLPEDDVSKYKLDEDGHPIQAVDADGEPLFDDETGEPVYELADAE